METRRFRSFPCHKREKPRHNEMTGNAYNAFGVAQFYYLLAFFYSLNTIRKRNENENGGHSE